MIATASEAIKLLQQLNPEESLVITWWGEADFKEYKDPDQAMSLTDDAIDNCIGHVNDYVESQYTDEEE